MGPKSANRWLACGVVRGQSRTLVSSALLAAAADLAVQAAVAPPESCSALRIGAAPCNTQPCSDDTLSLEKFWQPATFRVCLPLLTVAACHPLENH